MIEKNTQNSVTLTLAAYCDLNIMFLLIIDA